MTRSDMHTNDELRINDELVSPNGRTKFTFQGDGHLVVTVDGKFMWGTWTNGRGGTVLRLQADGNLVMYTDNNEAIWSSNTNHHDGETMWLACQDDNNIVVYGNNTYLWATETAHVIPFRNIIYENTDVLVFYPGIQDQSGVVWNGRANSGPYWMTGKGRSTEVDYLHDKDENGNPLRGRVSDRGMKLMVNRDGGHDVMCNEKTLRFDENCKDRHKVSCDGGVLKWVY